jgi:hypothetical protein
MAQASIRMHTSIYEVRGRERWRSAGGARHAQLPTTRAAGAVHVGGKERG